MSDQIGAMLFALTILIVLFVLGREFMCWYWKVNKALKLLEEIRDGIVGKKTEATGTKDGA